MTESMMNNGRSEPGGSEGSVAGRESPAEVRATAVGKKTRGAVPTAEVRETTAVVEAGFSRSESGSAEGSAAVGERLKRAVPTAVRDTTARDDTILGNKTLRNLCDGTPRNCVVCRGWPTEG